MRKLLVVFSALIVVSGCGVISRQVVKDYLTAVITGSPYEDYLSRSAGLDGRMISDYTINDFSILRTARTKDALMGDGAYDLVIADVVFQNQFGSPITKTKRFYVKDGYIVRIE